MQVWNQIREKDEKQMRLNIGNFIYSMYITPPETIETDFILIYEGDMVAKGKAIIHDESEIINLTGNFKDVNIKRFINKNNNTIVFNSNDLPLICSCQLMNFPLKDRKNGLGDKDIVIDFPKVKINSDFSFSLSTINTFKFEIMPLYVVNENNPLLCNIILQ